MGGGYSDLNIYFKHLGDVYSGKGYDVKVSRNPFPECSDFVVFKHTIEFKENFDPLYYNVILYKGYTDLYKEEYVFGYYYPNDKNQVIQDVIIYYSVVAPDSPLVITINTKGNQKYHCLPAGLKKARWDRAYNITEYTFSSRLGKEQLFQEFKKLTLNRKIRFKIGNESNLISGNEQILGSDYYRFIYLPGGNESILGCDHLFSLDSVKDKPSVKNKINNYFLYPLDGKLYDGIIVYYKKETRFTKYTEGTKDAVLLEFIDSSKEKVQLKKKDKKGNWWSRESVPYNNNTELLKELQNITEQATDSCVTVILEERKQYEGLQNLVKEDKNKTYTKYTFKFDEQKEPNLLYGRQKIAVGSESLKDVKAKNVEVYYLKTEAEDKQPFLIVFDKNGNGKKDENKAYHFDIEYGFEKWKQFNCKTKEPEKQLSAEQLMVKLEERLKRIEENLKCLNNLNLLRLFAHKILDGEDPTEEQIKKEVEKQRPDLKIPQKPPDGLPIQWIIAGSVGGGVFVISSAALYGVYWYNTTIKLLT